MGHLERANCLFFFFFLNLIFRLVEVVSPDQIAFQFFLLLGVKCLVFQTVCVLLQCVSFFILILSNILCPLYLYLYFFVLNLRKHVTV